MVQPDTKAPYSNYGPIIDIWAPGSATAAWIGSTTAVSTISGTTVAAAYTSGVVAYFIALFGVTGIQALGLVSSWCTTGILAGVPAGTVNCLLYNASGL